MTVRTAAEALVARAESFGIRGRILSTDERERLVTTLPIFPNWLLDLLSTVPLCGLELGWQAYDPEPDFDGIDWIEVSNAEGILWESLEGYPGLVILAAGYVNFGGDSSGGGNPYFVPIYKGEDPPLYQVYHDVGMDATTILVEGCRLVAARLSDFFQTAMLKSA